MEDSTVAQSGFNLVGFIRIYSRTFVALPRLEVWTGSTTPGCLPTAATDSIVLSLDPPSFCATTDTNGSPCLL